MPQSAASVRVRPPAVTRGGDAFTSTSLPRRAVAVPDGDLAAASTPLPHAIAPTIGERPGGSVAAGALSGAVPVPLGDLPAAPLAVVREAGDTAVDMPRAVAVTTAPVPRVSEEPAVREILARYGTAYTQLDARAARAVWPGVDARALSRAFEALESQTIVFERCDVTVDGRAARAACRGTSTWVPRVGERRPHRERREWTFRLEKAGDAQWQIQSASMK